METPSSQTSQASQASQASEGDWVKVRVGSAGAGGQACTISRTLSVGQPQRDCAAWLLLAWAVFVHRGSTWSSEGETIGFCLHAPPDADEPRLPLQTLQISRLFRSTTTIIADAFQSALEVVSTAIGADNGVSHGQEIILHLSNDVHDVHDGDSKFGITGRVNSGELMVTLARKPVLLAAELAAVSIDAFTYVVESLLSLRAATTRTTTVQDALGPSPPELDRVWSWNAAVPPTIDRCVHDMISERTLTRADHAAVVSWDGQLTYAEVDRLSSTLARQLMSHGVRNGDVVPLCFSKSMWTIVGVLGVLKTGAGIALTDPSQPEARLRTIAEEVNAKLLVTSTSHTDLGRRIAPSGIAVAVGPALLQASSAAAATSTCPPQPISSDSTLYVIFTSGSTGKPKGVVITHANYLSGAIPRAEKVGYTPRSRVLDFPSYAFDVSIDCMLCTLLNGGCICVPSEEERVNDLNGAIRRMDVNMAHMTPSVARVLDADIMPSLEVLGLGGESIAPGDAAEWSQLTKIVIAYGPSECTVGCTINNDVDGTRPYTAIGKGVGGLMWIVDPEDHERLAPLGAVGELLVEGPIVGAGYLNEPGKTAASFIRDPSWLARGPDESRRRQGVLYKTGDLVRYDPDGSGSIVFVGRGDQQVKLRGQRVELGEIEHHLRNELPGGISVAAEVVRPDNGSGEPMLLAFISEQTKDTSDADCEVAPLSHALANALAGVEGRLAAVLPRYMVPHVYVCLKDMPLLVSLKTDRKRLRSIASGMSRRELSELQVAGAHKLAPTSRAEILLVGLWQRILGSDLDISANDDFFELGGDSLRAMRLVAVARQEGWRLTVLNIFRHPKLSDLALLLVATSSRAEAAVQPFSLLPSDWKQEKMRAAAAGLCGVGTDAIEDVYPCTPLQEGLMALSEKVADAYTAQRVVSLESTASLGRLRRAFEVVAHDCPILRTRIVQVRGAGLFQVVLKEHIECISATDLEAYLTEDRARTMGLGTPLCRLAVVEDSRTNALSMVLTIHHALYDGWSMPLVIDRINRAYQGLALSKPPPFSAFIRHLSSLDKSAAATYWHHKLDGATSLQFPPAPYPTYQHRPESLLERYVRLPNQKQPRVSVATLIRGAWALVSSRYTASDDVVFGETLTGRNAPVDRVEQIEGPMINTVPTRVQIQRHMAVSEYLQMVHEASVERMPHEHYGLQHIRQLSLDARAACDLRTGLVIHPTEEDGLKEAATPGPADGFVPTNDAEAAQEALKFNSYGLMLVFTQDTTGFLVMASFDPNMIDPASMTRVLAEFDTIIQRLCQDTQQSVLEVLEDGNQAAEEQWQANVTGVTVVGQDDADLTELRHSGLGLWVVDPREGMHFTPSGAVGELLIEGAFGLSECYLPAPAWLSLRRQSGGSFLHRTGRYAQYMNERKLQILGRIVDGVHTQHAVPPDRSKIAQVTNAKQQLLRRLWGRVLGMSEAEIGATDIFFDLGGDSIGAMKLVSEARAEGYTLTVSQIFQTRHLHGMAAVLEACEHPEVSQSSKYQPFSTVKAVGLQRLLQHTVRPALQEQSWTVTDVYPVRPLQQVAIEGTYRLPRYSQRYELFYLDEAIDVQRLLRACQELVTRNEILRTVFVQCEESKLYYGVVLDSVTAPTAQYEIEGDLSTFTKDLCDLDVRTSMPLGSLFVKFFLVQGEGKRSCLVLRISHAQYDEVCLPLLLRQLSALYEERPIPDTVGFAPYVHHVLRTALPDSLAYWRRLLQGSSMTVYRPAKPATDKTMTSISKSVSIADRDPSITVATLPTAAWALCLARLVSTRDVTFGEVVSGRNTGFPNADKVMGPAWQYIPVRVQFGKNWTVTDLLQYVQDQHIASGRHEAAGLEEVVQNCTDWPQNTRWFDSVVHQDVAHVERLNFSSATSRMETIYPHLEPLREWKIQAFPAGDTMTVEVVTFQSWLGPATHILDEMVGIMRMLVNSPSMPLF
ncbi:Nonribosomal Peptide Synthase (NRPS) [Ascosphaera acerosa]|nr:Nonribosomal Peptide Synthase (NRPS) [Ascosphaera acerosa]